MPRILGVIAALLVSAGLLGNGAATAVDDPTLAGAPAVGSCYAITAAQVEDAAVAQAPVDCATPHTTEVIAVSTLPAALTWESPQADYLAEMSTQCWQAFERVLGRNVLQVYRSQYSMAMFGPTAEQQGAGARWFGCHAIVVDHDGLADVPHPLPRLSNKLPDAVATCLTRASMFTTCAQAHAWRSSHAFYATGKANQKTAVKAADRVCPRNVTTKAWYYTWQDVPGPRYVVGCYSKTRR